LNNGRIIDPNAAPVQAAMQIAQPLNDAQLVALIASKRPDCSAADAVTWAIELVAETIVRVNRNKELIKACERGSS